MQWWGSITQQFQNIATQALQDVSSKAAPFQAPFQTHVQSGSQPAKSKPVKSKPGAAKTAPASKATSAARKGFTPANRPRG
jgi:hypothetical protein